VSEKIHTNLPANGNGNAASATPTSDTEHAVRVAADDAATHAQNNGHVAQPRSEEDWAYLLWSHRRLLFGWTVRGLLASTLLAFLIPKRYESTARIIPSENSSSAPMAMMAAMGGKGSALGMLANGLLSAKEPGGAFIGILESDTLRDRLIDRFDLRKVYWDRYMYDARKDLAHNTDISLDHKTGVIAIVVTDRDPKRAAALGRAYVEELDHMTAKLSTSSARLERQFIEQRLQTVKQNLEDAAQQFSQYASKNTTLDVPAQTKAMVDATASLQGQLIAAQSELEGLEQIYTNNNIRVRSMQARIAELKRQMQKMNGDSTPPAPDGGRNDSIDSDELYPPVRQLPLLGVRWADLYRETKIQETVYEMLTQQYELAKIQEAKEVPIVKVLDEAAVPEKKSSPPRLVIMIVGSLFAFALASAWILSRARWEQADPSDPRHQLHEDMLRVLQNRAVETRRWMGDTWPFRWIISHHSSESV
jgi:uncharacterized protein involved in exopolysaccharide biosynthesis